MRDITPRSRLLERQMRTAVLCNLSLSRPLNDDTGAFSVDGWADGQVGPSRLHSLSWIEGSSAWEEGKGGMAVRPIGLGTATSVSGQISLHTHSMVYKRHREIETSISSGCSFMFFLQTSPLVTVQWQFWKFPPRKRASPQSYSWQQNVYHWAIFLGNLSVS